VPPGNPSPKLAITIAPDVHEQVLAAAARRGISVSAWMTDAARLALKVRAGLAAVAEWEAEHGPLTGAELDVHVSGVVYDSETSSAESGPFRAGLTRAAVGRYCEIV
jgi:hypothetical protein